MEVMSSRNGSVAGAAAVAAIVQAFKAFGAQGDISTSQGSTNVLIIFNGFHHDINEALLP
jgi:hypothetical protein